MRQKPETTYKLSDRTIILDQDEGLHLFVSGVIPLPVGSVVQLGDPNRDAVVTRVRLIVGPQDEATLCLDVDVKPAGERPSPEE